MKKMKADPHYNALQVKYAYAITCHKAQGGQWRMNVSRLLSLVVYGIYSCDEDVVFGDGTSDLVDTVNIGLFFSLINIIVIHGRSNSVNIILLN